ncbi:putative F-box protein At1g32420 [Magnolia sinica]|uniref:putative F-box protein At1g32420 n=1 Tax=Magnolia sinica TaxID=86752 RepID=UPI002658015C|nr:putative F-box protein At1g32420 [Magnolia sinica]
MEESRAVNRRGLLGLILTKILNCLRCSEVENSREIEKGENERLPREVEKGENERLPFDLVVEILAWLPVKSLIKFRCVCNQWRKLLLDPMFISMHAERSKHIYVHSEDVDQRITTCVCEGLLLVVNKKEDRNHVCNPSIHQTFQLPPLNPPLFPSNSFTYLNVSCVPEHKVVATTQDNRCLVVVVGTPTSSWKDLGFIPNHCGGTRFYSSRNVYNVLHWVFTNNSTGEVNVVSLDSLSENFNVNIAPRGLSTLAADNYPMCWEGCFALGCIVEKKMMVWILRDVKNDIWEKEIVWLTSLNFELGSENFHPYSKSKDNGWITFIKNSPKEYYYYHIVTNRTLHKCNAEANRMFYKPSLVSCNGISKHDGPMPDWFLPLLSELKL